MKLITVSNLSKMTTTVIFVAWNLPLMKKRLTQSIKQCIQLRLDICLRITYKTSQTASQLIQPWNQNICAHRQLCWWKQIIFILVDLKSTKAKTKEVEHLILAVNLFQNYMDMQNVYLRWHILVLWSLNQLPL